MLKEVRQNIFGRGNHLARMSNEYANANRNGQEQDVLDPTDDKARSRLKKRRCGLYADIYVVGNGYKEQWERQVDE